jgi:hypothetical protein
MLGPRGEQTQHNGDLENQHTMPNLRLREDLKRKKEKRGFVDREGILFNMQTTWGLDHRKDNLH